MTKLRIADLLASAPADPRTHLDPKRVAHYVQVGEALEPVTVFDTPDGLLLADGYHRLAAAQARGATAIDADVRSGSRSDALKYAAAVAAAQRGITPERAEDIIRTRGMNR